MTSHTMIDSAIVLLLLLTAGVARATYDAASVSEQGVRTAVAAPQNASAPAPLAAKTRAADAALDLKALEEQLKDTKAIGFFTKMTLKNQVDDLLDDFRKHYEGKGKLTMTDLRRSYELLMLKVLSLLQDDDPTLASAIVSSREAIWRLLADPKTFATLQG
jgi:hypothetical protein